VLVEMSPTAPSVDEARGNLGQPVGFWLGWFGALVGAMSTISALARLLKTGLSGIFADMVAYYHRLLTPVHRLIEMAHLPFPVPPVAVDLGALYIVLLAMSWRASFMTFLASVREYNRQAGAPDAGAPVYGRRTAYFRLPFRVASWLLLWPIVSLQPLRMYQMFAWEYRMHAHLPRKSDDDPISTALAFRKWGMDLYRNATLQLFALPVAVIIFFAANAYS
jgi:hypothetical protein